MHSQPQRAIIADRQEAVKYYHWMAGMPSPGMFRCARNQSGIASLSRVKGSSNDLVGLGPFFMRRLRLRLIVRQCLAHGDLGEH
jgi:hypothetical protein